MELGSRTLSRHGYSVPLACMSQAQLRQHKKDLKIVPVVPNQQFQNFHVKPIVLFRETKRGALVVPRYYGQQHFGAPTSSVFSTLPYRRRENNLFAGDLRDYQRPMVAKCIAALESNGGGVLSISPGMGKTCCALYMVGHFRCKALIIVHTSTLLNQWVERIEQFLPAARIGIIRANKVETGDDIDIGIATVQSLSLKSYTEDTFSSFEMVVYDEIDRMCTKVFSRSFSKVATRYTFGLSATPFREDKCEKIFEYYIGPIVHYEKRPPDATVQVETLYVKYDEFEPEYDRNGDISYTKTVIKLSNDEERNRIITCKIIDIMRTDGRKLLVLGSYIDQLEQLDGMLAAKKPPFSHSLYTGRMKEPERAVAQEADVMLATYSLASVGMDVPALNALLLATPRKAIEQSVGRIMRKSNNVPPFIVDVVDSNMFFVNQARKRRIFYKNNGYTVTTSRRTIGTEARDPRVDMDFDL